MTRRRFRIAAAGVIVTMAVLGAVVRNQVKVYRARQATAALMLLRNPVGKPPLALPEQRQALFDLLRPVALANCQMERFGETYDGGYLMCANLLRDVQSAYSYGISGYDQWGCDIATRFNLTVHQYDCFNTTQPACATGAAVFHAECVGDTTATVEGRAFDTISNQLLRNGDDSKRIVLKIDVEGAEWDSLLSIPVETLERIDQMAVEFHWAEDDGFRWLPDDKYLRVVRRLQQFFEVAHIHFNNASCIEGLEPFPGWAYEVLFVSKRLAVVNKRLAVVDSTRHAGGRHLLDSPNNPSMPDCQPQGR